MSRSYGRSRNERRRKANEFPPARLGMPDHCRTGGGGGFSHADSPAGVPDIHVCRRGLPGGGRRDLPAFHRLLGTIGYGQGRLLGTAGNEIDTRNHLCKSEGARGAMMTRRLGRAWAVSLLLLGFVGTLLVTTGADATPQTAPVQKPTPP